MAIERPSTQYIYVSQVLFKQIQQYSNLNKYSNIQIQQELREDARWGGYWSLESRGHLYFEKEYAILKHYFALVK